MTARFPAARAAASVILAGALLLGTAGCSFMSTKATLIQYDPSDGIGIEVGEIKALNTMAVLGADGQTANLLVTLVNTGERDRNVQLQYEAGSSRSTVSAYVPAGEAVSFGNAGDEKTLLLEGLDIIAGSLLPVYVQYGQEEGSLGLVPVLDGSWAEYAPLAP